MSALMVQPFSFGLDASAVPLLSGVAWDASTFFVAAGAVVLLVLLGFLVYLWREDRRETRDICRALGIAWDDPDRDYLVARYELNAWAARSDARRARAVALGLVDADTGSARRARR